MCTPRLYRRRVKTVRGSVSHPKRLPRKMRRSRTSTYAFFRSQPIVKRRLGIMLKDGAEVSRRFMVSATPMVLVVHKVHRPSFGSLFIHRSVRVLAGLEERNHFLRMAVAVQLISLKQAYTLCRRALDMIVGASGSPPRNPGHHGFEGPVEARHMTCTTRNKTRKYLRHLQLTWKQLLRAGPCYVFLNDVVGTHGHCLFLEGM